MYNDKNIKDWQNMQQWKQINATPLLRVHAKRTMFDSWTGFHSVLAMKIFLSAKSRSLQVFGGIVVSNS